MDKKKKVLSDQARQQIKADKQKKINRNEIIRKDHGNSSVQK